MKLVTPLWWLKIEVITGSRMSLTLQLEWDSTLKFSACQAHQIRVMELLEYRLHNGRVILMPSRWGPPKDQELLTQLPKGLTWLLDPWAPQGLWVQAIRFTRRVRKCRIRVTQCGNRLTRKSTPCNRPKIESREEALQKLFIATQTKAPTFRIKRVREFKAACLKRTSRTTTGGSSRPILPTSSPGPKRSRSSGSLAKCSSRPTPQCLPRACRGATSISSRRSTSTWRFPKTSEASPLARRVGRTATRWWRTSRTSTRRRAKTSRWWRPWVRWDPSVRSSASKMAQVLESMAFPRATTRWSTPSTGRTQSTTPKSRSSSTTPSCNKCTSTTWTRCSSTRERSSSPKLGSNSRVSEAVSKLAPTWDRFTVTSSWRWEVPR